MPSKGDPAAQADAREGLTGQRGFTRLGALVAVAALALPGTALAASEVGTGFTVGPKPASHALLARAGKLVLADAKRANAASLAAGGDVNVIYSKVACKGTVKRIVCTAWSYQTMAPTYIETVLVRHGKLIGQGGASGQAHRSGGRGSERRPLPAPTRT